MLKKKEIDVKKTSFEKRLDARTSLKPLFHSDINSKQMKKDIYKNYPNESIYNHIINNFYIYNNYYSLLSIYYPLFFISYQQQIKDVKVKCINFIYDNNQDNNINFMTFLYNAHLNDKDLNLDNFLYLVYGISLDSADGQVMLRYYNKKYFHYLFNYNNPNLINFLDDIYKAFLKYDFFKINSIIINENNILVNNIFYFKFLSFFIFNIYYTYITGDIFNNSNSKFKTFLTKNRKVLNKILTEFPYGITLRIHDHYDKMVTEVYTKKKTEHLETVPIYKMIFYYQLLRIITKFIPKDLNNYYLNELNINNKINLLLFNNITEFLPLTINYVNIRNKFLYNNPNIIAKFKENKKYQEIINMLSNINKYDKIITQKDIKTNVTTAENLQQDIESIISKLNKNILTNESIAIFMEDVGKPFYDYPFFLLNMVKEFYKLKNTEQNILATVNLINSQLFYSNVRFYIFNIIYTLYALNTKIGVIHRDLHLNNLTINVNQTQRFVSRDPYLTLCEKNSKEMVLSKLFVLCRNLFVLKNKNIKNNAFLIPTNFFNISIIDFSRSLDKKNKYECSQKLFEMVLEIYPEYSNNKEFKDKLYNISLLKTDILFDIMSGYDIYNLLKYFYSFFTDNIFLKLKFFPKQPLQELSFIDKMFTYIQKTMIKNIKKLMDNKFKGYISNTNELLLYKFYNNFLIKNYEKNDFYKSTLVKKGDDQANFFQFLDDDEWIEIFNTNKIYVSNIYNIQNELKIKDLSELINKYIFINNNKDNNYKKLNKYIT